MKCPMCLGKGMVDYPMYADDEHKWQYCVARMKKCDMCNGTGEVPMTNEEYIRTCTTEQLAEVLWEQINGAFNSGYACCNLKQDKDYIGRYKKFVEWLKQPHLNE